MNQQYTVREFIRLTPPQKQRLQKRDPKQYKELCEKMEREFSKDTDQEALQELNRKR